jgi:glutaminyl-tRNA synthetase
VDDQSAEVVSATRGTPTKPGIESPFRNRSIEENLNLFEQMKNGEFPNGSKVLRAKIDMASPNMWLRDPALYRIKKVLHHRTGDTWCIYPMYDFAHGQSDYIEGITHSICTLEFEVHRPLYDWILDHIAVGPRPRQYEFARLNLNYTIMSKRRLLELVNGGYVNGWDDPRMPTISAMRRRGYTPESIRNFSERVGVAKRDNIIDVAFLEYAVREDLNKNIIDVAFLEYAVREDLNKKALRRMAVLDPLKVVINNYPEGKTEMLSARNNPENESDGFREVPFSRELYIEKNDFMEDPPKKFFRLMPGGEVRLKYAYIIKCQEIIKNPDTGEIEEIRCTYDPDTKSGLSGSQRKVKGTIHWVSVDHAVTAEVRLYDRLFLDEDPAGKKDGSDFKDYINPDSLKVIEKVFVEPSIIGSKKSDKFQFERKGYFCVDPDSEDDKLIFNRTVTLRDTWAKKSQK